MFAIRSYKMLLIHMGLPHTKCGSLMIHDTLIYLVSYSFVYLQLTSYQMLLIHMGLTHTKSYSLL